MKRIVEIIRFYSLDEINNYIQKRNDYPTHHAWCYDVLLSNNYNICCVDYNKNTLVNKIGKKLGVVNLQQQINCFNSTTKNDIIFAPFIKDIFILALLKIFKLYRTPILTISHVAHVPKQKNILKRVKVLMIRNIYFLGIDKILFLNEKMYCYSNDFKKIPKKHSYLENWGVDFIFFNSYSINQKCSPKNDFIFSPGGTNRDFKILIEAFRKMNVKLKIIPKSLSNIPDGVQITENIEIGSSIPDLYSYSSVRNDYYNCLAVAIPLIKELDYYPTGSTILFESMAMGKAVITTKNKAYPFDVEEEKIGLNVDYGDVEGWIKAVNYLISNPIEAKEMGIRAKKLCENKYNYELFSKEIEGHLKDLLVED